MLEREWQRPVDAELYISISEGHRPSARTIVVLVFWSYFETRIEKLFREVAKVVPAQVMEHLLEHSSFVGTRCEPRPPHYTSFTSHNPGVGPPDGGH